MGKVIKIVGILLFILCILLLVAWRIDRAYFHPYDPNRNDQIRSDITSLKFSVPKDKMSCEEKGGVWKKIGIRPREECNLPTTDAGKACSSSNVCEGVCLAELSSDDLRTGMKGKILKTDGKCSSFIKVVGCKGYVYRGWASVVCAD
jgi:hypothetical protein